MLGMASPAHVHPGSSLSVMLTDSRGMEAQSGMQSSEQEEIGMGDHTEPRQAPLATSLTCCSFCFAALMLLPSDGGLGLPAN